MFRVESKHLTGKYYSDFSHLLISVTSTYCGFVFSILTEDMKLDSKLPKFNKDTSLVGVTNFSIEWQYLWIEFFVGKEPANNVVKLDNYR